MDYFFESDSPRYMWEKAKRDLERMKANLSTDTILDFFVTTNHIMDYVQAQGNVPEAEIDFMKADADFERCRFLANKGKHLQLRRPPPYQTYHNPGATLGKGELGTVHCGEAESYAVVDGTTGVPVLDLAHRLIVKWEAFLARNGL